MWGSRDVGVWGCRDAGMWEMQGCQDAEMQECGERTEMVSRGRMEESKCNGPLQSRSCRACGRGSLLAAGPITQSAEPTKGPAPSAAQDPTKMQNRVLHWRDESLIIFISHVVKPPFREVQALQEQSSNMHSGTKGESGCSPQGENTNGFMDSFEKNKSLS